MGRLKKAIVAALAVVLAFSAALGNAGLDSVFALAGYGPQDGYSDVVEKRVELPVVAPGEEVSSSDKFLVVDHEDRWGTRDCTVFTIPEAGTVKLYLKNTSDYWMYGSTVLLFANKDLTKKIELKTDELAVDGGGEASGSAYLEAGTYYLYTESKNYEGNEFVAGSDTLYRRTQLWAGYIPQSRYISENSVELSADKSKAVIRLNLPDEYDTLRVEDYFVGYEYLKSGSVWQTDSRANTLENGTYTATHNGWHSFRLAMGNGRAQADGWGCIQHVLVTGIGGEEYEEPLLASGNLPVVDGTGRTVQAISSFRDLDDRIDGGMEPVFELNRKKYTEETFSITVKETGTLYLKGYTQANYWMYSEVTVDMFYDKDMKTEQAQFKVDGTGAQAFSLFPGTYTFRVSTFDSMDNTLDGTDYLDRHFTLYGGFMASDSLMKEDVAYSADRKSATVTFKPNQLYRVKTINVYDYDVNRIVIANKWQGKSMEVKENRVTVDRNGIYTVYAQGENKDVPPTMVKKFEVTGIDGDAYVKEKKEDPAKEIPYAASISQLIDNVLDGQRPMLTHKQNFSSSTGVEKFTISERTVVYSYLSDRCHYGWYDIKAGFYKDFQCTDEVYSVTFNTNQDKGTFGIFEPGTYYIMAKCGSNEDGIGIPQELNWYIGGVRYADVAKEPVVAYNAGRTKAEVKLALLNYENITKVNCYKGKVDYSDTKESDRGYIQSVENTDTVTLTENGDYTFSIFPDASRSLYNRAVAYVTVDGIGKQPGTGSGSSQDSGNAQAPDKGSANMPAQTPDTSGAPDGYPEHGASGTGVGTVLKSGENIYKVSAGGTVAYMKPAGKMSAVSIPATISIDGVSYKVASIDKNAFAGNGSVKKVTVGKNVASIGNNAFKGCRKLASVTIGSGVKKIGAGAFSGCKKLKAITINSTKLSSVGKNALKGIHANAKIKVPSSKLKAYKKLLKGKGQGGKVKITK